MPAPLSMWTKSYSMFQVMFPFEGKGTDGTVLFSKEVTVIKGVWAEVGWLLPSCYSLERFWLFSTKWKYKGEDSLNPSPPPTQAQSHHAVRARESGRADLPAGGVFQTAWACCYENWLNLPQPHPINHTHTHTHTHTLFFPSLSSNLSS